MKLLTFSTLYPNSERPQHGIFVETRLRHLLASDKAQSRVVAPIPWFPFTNRRFGKYAAFARVPIKETRHGILVDHPRYPLLPKIGMELAPLMLAKAIKPVFGRLIDEGYHFDLIDAHYFYPDGVAAAMLGKYFNKPVVITARGSDISLLPQYRVPRKQILWATSQAKGLITVCNALKLEMVKLGVDPERISPLRNGVDLDFFRPSNRDLARSQFGLRRFTLLSAGNLVPLKGHDLVIRALPMMPDVELLIAGSGPEQDALSRLAQQLRIVDRVTFLGALPQAELRVVYGAVDALVLASSREGWANVLLESMACGTPVIASNVYGTPEVITAPEAGILLPQRTPDAIVAAVTALRTNGPSRTMTRNYAERFSWSETTSGQLDLFRRILEQSAA